MGDPSSGFTRIPHSIRETKILMRNECAKMGGNFLVVDTIASASGITSKTNASFAGSGRAYKCPQPNINKPAGN